MRSPLARLSPARRRFVVGVVAVLGVLVLAALAFGVTAAVRAAHTPLVSQDRPGPVLLVPGYGGNASSLSGLAARLRTGGRDVTIVHLPDGAEGDLSAQAETLGPAADAAMDRTGASSVDLVGYSAGGVVAKLWVTEGGGGSRTRRLVMLGSPLHGTDIAQLGTLVSGACPTACQQLAPNSTLLSRLDGEALPRGVVALSLWSTSDDVIQPPSSSIVDGVSSPSVQSICATNRSTHSALPTDPMVQAVITEALGPASLPTWGSVDCPRLSS